jgi:hypothetical protein
MGKAMKRIYARQGDLLFLRTDELSEGEPMKKLVIERGEITGHAHFLVCEARSTIYGNKAKFTLTGKARLVHDEHAPITFTKGNYVVIRKSEYDPIDEELKTIQD